MTDQPEPEVVDEVHHHTPDQLRAVADVEEAARDAETLRELDDVLAGLTEKAAPSTALALGVTRSVLAGFRETVLEQGHTIRETAARFR